MTEYWDDQEDYDDEIDHPQDERPPARSRRNWLLVAGILVAFLVACCGGGVVGLGITGYLQSDVGATLLTSNTATPRHVTTLAATMAASTPTSTEMPTLPAAPVLTDTAIPEMAPDSPTAVAIDTPPPAETPFIGDDTGPATEAPPPTDALLPPAPTDTPVPAEPTATPEPSATPAPAEAYKIVHFKVLGDGENNGGVFNAGGQHLIFLTVLDASGNGVDGAVVKDANASNLEVVTGDKGPGKAEITMEFDPYKLYVAADPGGPTTSETSHQMNTVYPDIADVVGKLGSLDNEYSVCPTADVRCQPPFYNVHFSYEITFQKVN